MSVIHSSDAPVGYREGPDLDALVAEIAAEHPKPVRFIDVDRVRRGGVMGFFAKESYALTYEVPADSAGRTDTVPGSNGIDLNDLINDAEVKDVPVITTEKPRSLAETPSFADVLLSLAERTVDEPALTKPAAGSTPAGSEAEKAGRHRFTPAFAAAEVRAAYAPEPAPAPVPAAVPAPFSTPPAASISAPATASIPGPESVSRHRVDAMATVPAAAVSTEAASEATPLFDSVATWTPPAARPVIPLAAPTLAPAPDVLQALGVPAGWGAASADRARIVAAIVGAVEALPAAPLIPSRAGELTVIVAADTDLAAITADQIGELIGADIRPATTRREALAAGAALRAGDRPGLLVIPADDISEPIAELVAAAHAELVVVAVEATGKSCDHRRLVEQVPGVDALAVHRSARTSSPASVWELGVPVALLDGQPATFENWLALLLRCA